MRSRSLRAWAVLTGFAVSGLVVAAVVDRTVDPVPTPAGFGAGPTSAGRRPHRGLGGSGRPGVAAVTGLGQFL